MFFLYRLELGRPASLHPLKIPTGNLWEEHCVVADFEKDSNQQLSVTAGSKVIVISKDGSGKDCIVTWVPINSHFLGNLFMHIFMVMVYSYRLVDGSTQWQIRLGTSCLPAAMHNDE